MTVVVRYGVWVPAAAGMTLWEVTPHYTDDLEVVRGNLSAKVGW